jgi:hypothetical protein
MGVLGETEARKQSPAFARAVLRIRRVSDQWQDQFFSALSGETDNRPEDDGDPSPMGCQRASEVNRLIRPV